MTTFQVGDLVNVVGERDTFEVQEVNAKFIFVSNHDHPAARRDSAPWVTGGIFETPANAAQMFKKI